MLSLSFFHILTHQYTWFKRIMVRVIYTYNGKTMQMKVMAKHTALSTLFL